VKQEELEDYLMQCSRKHAYELRHRYDGLSPEQIRRVQEERHEELRRLRVDAALVVKSTRFGKNSVYCS
jgi:hypothetical protein